MQLAVIAGRVVGLPLPNMPSAASIGLNNPNAGLFDNEYDGKIAKQALNTMWNSISDIGAKDSLQWGKESL